jgi:zinc transport system permease protein
MTIPVAASLQLAKSFRQAALWSVLFAETAVLSGLASAYYLDWASGGTIVLVSVLLFVLVLTGNRVALRVVRGGERQSVW